MKTDTAKSSLQLQRLLRKTAPVTLAAVVTLTSGVVKTPTSVLARVPSDASGHSDFSPIRHPDGGTSYSSVASSPEVEAPPSPGPVTSPNTTPDPGAEDAKAKAEKAAEAAEQAKVKAEKAAEAAERAKVKAEEAAKAAGRVTGSGDQQSRQPSAPTPPPPQPGNGNSNPNGRPSRNTPKPNGPKPDPNKAELDRLIKERDDLMESIKKATPGSRERVDKTDELYRVNERIKAIESKMGIGKGRQSPVSGKIDSRFGDLKISRYGKGPSKQGIEPGKETVVITHGWDPSGDNIEQLAKTASKYDVQVLELDWRSIASGGLDKKPSIPYNTAEWIAPVARWAHGRLVELGINPKQLTLVGHSLGSYVNAEIAQQFGQVKNLVALDPAYPAHNIGKPDIKLGPYTAGILRDARGGILGYDIDGRVSGRQSPADFEDVATNSLAFIARNSERVPGLLAPHLRFPGGVHGDNDKAASAHNSFVVQFPIFETHAHSLVVDAFTDALDKGYLKLPDLTLPNHKNDQYSDNGNKLDRLPGWLKRPLDNHHEGRISATSTGEIKEWKIVIDSSGKEEEVSRN